MNDVINLDKSPQLMHDCRSRQCVRGAPKGIAYCCKPCADAWEAVPRYDTGAHSDECHKRTPQFIKDKGY